MQCIRRFDESVTQSAIWTVGHSTHSGEHFLALLGEHRIELLADVRRFPASRRHPQFNRAELEAALSTQGIGYRHFEALGGRRSRGKGDSPNTAWRVEAFNAYADHLSTPEAGAALDDLMRLASRSRTAIMCAEVLPWRCHRRIIADALLARGWQVSDIMGLGQVRDHTLPEFARVSGGEVTYPGGTLF